MSKKKFQPSPAEDPPVLSLEEDYIPKKVGGSMIDISVEEPLLMDFTPIDQMSWKIECENCKVLFKFTPKEVFRVSSTLWNYGWGVKDAAQAKCPRCRKQVTVNKVIPEWLLESDQF